MFAIQKTSKEKSILIYFIPFTARSKTYFLHATSADKDQPKPPCRLVMVGTVRYSFSLYFETYPKLLDGFVQIGKWSGSFKIFSGVKEKNAVVTDSTSHSKSMYGSNISSIFRKIIRLNVLSNQYSSVCTLSTEEICKTRITLFFERQQSFHYYHFLNFTIYIGELYLYRLLIVTTSHAFKNAGENLFFSFFEKKMKKKIKHNNSHNS
jgi:hypothetical protein